MVKWRADNDTIHVRKSTATGGTHVDIQAAVDEALASGSRIRRVRIPAGDWQVGAPISLSPAAPSTLTLGLELVGERPAFATGDLSRFTNLRATFNNQPIIQASLTRGLSVADLVLWGTNAISANFANLDSLLLDSVWLASGVTANHVGIALDNDVPVNGGSSAWTIRNVHFRDLARGLTVGAHANAQNGSEGTVDSCVFDFCGEAGYAPGHTQTKAVTFINCFWNGCKRIADGRLVGQLAGFPPTIVGGGVTLCQRLVEFSQGAFHCSLNNVESTYGIGTLGSGFSLSSRPAVFQGTQFDFWWPSAAGKHIGAHLYTFNQVEFSSCTFAHAGSNNPATFRVHNPNANVTFSNCWFDCKADSGRLPIDAYDPTRMRLNSCEYQDGVAKFDLHGAGVHSDLSLGGGTLVSTGPGVATLTIGGISAADIGVGDQLAPSVAWVPKNRAADNPSTLSIGEVVNKVSNTVTINGVPEEIEASPPGAQEWFRRRLLSADTIGKLDVFGVDHKATRLGVAGSEERSLLLSTLNNGGGDPGRNWIIDSGHSVNSGGTYNRVGQWGYDCDYSGYPVSGAGNIASGYAVEHKYEISPGVFVTEFHTRARRAENDQWPDGTSERRVHSSLVYHATGEAQAGVFGRFTVSSANGVQANVELFDGVYEPTGWNKIFKRIRLCESAGEVVIGRTSALNDGTPVPTEKLTIQGDVAIIGGEVGIGLAADIDRQAALHVSTSQRWSDDSGNNRLHLTIPTTNEWWLRPMDGTLWIGAAANEASNGVLEVVPGNGVRCVGIFRAIASGADRIVAGLTGVEFNGAVEFAKPTITGSRGGNAALADLLTKLASYGLITDGTS